MEAYYLPKLLKLLQCISSIRRADKLQKTIDRKQCICYNFELAEASAFLGRITVFVVGLHFL